jgi:hypothetical protein
MTSNPRVRRILRAGADQVPLLRAPASVPLGHGFERHRAELAAVVAAAWLTVSRRRKPYSRSTPTWFVRPHVRLRVPLTNNARYELVL